MIGGLQSTLEKFAPIEYTEQVVEWMFGFFQNRHVRQENGAQQ